jgi:Phycobilisome protein
MTQPVSINTQISPVSRSLDLSPNPYPPLKAAQAAQSNLHSLPAIWARKYFVAVTSDYDAAQVKKLDRLSDYEAPEGRQYTTEKLMQNLKLSTAQAWSMTENLLSEEILRHGIDPSLLDPWKIAADSHQLFEKALVAYSNRLTAQRLAVIVGDDCGQLRQKYTTEDPRAIGFVSMQFHHTGKILLGQLEPAERSLFAPYLKVMDDHMYMPLRDAYQAAAKHEPDSPALLAVQNLLPISSRIAHRVCDQIRRLNPGYQTLSGSLNSSAVRTSSIRDAEMFLVYLCLCVLEGDVSAVQRQLFPLCIMLYPRLNVKWQMVQDMLQVMGWEMYGQLPAESMTILIPYLRTLTEMFSSEVFQGEEG